MVTYAKISPKIVNPGHIAGNTKEELIFFKRSNVKKPKRRLLKTSTYLCKLAYMIYLVSEPC